MAADNTVRVDVILDSKTKGIEKGAAKTADLRKENEKLSKVFQQVEKDARSLDDRISALTAHRFKLAKQLSENDDLELRKEFNRTNQRLGFFKKLASAVAGGAKGAGTDAFTKLTSQRVGNPSMGLVGGAAVIGAAALPPLGAMASGALAGTGVGAAMAGGILAASMDPSVQAAAHDFGQTISREFFASGDAFVGPIRNSLNILEADFQDLELEGAFAKAAPFVETVAHGIGDLAKNIMPGFNKLLERAGPYSEVFAEGLGDAGSAIGSFLDDVSSSEGALEGLETLFRLVNGSVVALGMGLNALSDTWDVYTDVMERFSGVMGSMPDWLQKVLFGHSMFDETNTVMKELNANSLGAADGLNTFGGAAGDAASDADALTAAIHDANKAFEDYFDINMSVDEATLNVQKGMLELQETLRKGNVDWSNQTEAGLRNRGMLLDQVDALNTKREAEIKASDGSKESIDKINAEYDKAIRVLRTMATNAGLTEQAFMNLAGTYTVTFFLQQKTGKEVVAWSELRNAERQLAENNSGPDIKRRFVKSFAHGGDTPAFEPFFTHPGEVMWDKKQHYVSTKAQTDALMRSGSSGGGGNFTFTVMPGGSDAFTRALAELLATHVRISGGDGAVLGIKRVSG